MKVTDVGAAYDPQFERVEISDNLREAAKAALLALKCLDGLECAREEIEALEAALAEGEQDVLRGFPHLVIEHVPFSSLAVPRLRWPGPRCLRADL